MSNNISILLLGGSGFLGSEIIKINNFFSILSPNKKHVDITDINSLDSFLEKHKPKLIINSAGLVNLEECEKKSSLSEKLNFQSVQNICDVCLKQNIPLIHISTDYVFGGCQNIPYIETDIPKPLNTYGIHKYEAEKHITTRLDKYLIIRTSWLYGKSKPNFFTLINQNKNNQIDIVDDQIGTPNLVSFIANEIIFLVNSIFKNGFFSSWGTYHLSCNSQTSWFLFAKKINSFSKNPILIRPISSQLFNSKNNILSIRPAYSVLNSQKFTKTFGRSFMNWENYLHLLASAK